MASLYMVPTTLGDSALNQVIPAAITNIVRNLKYFVVEDLRTARRYLKKIDREWVIDELDFKELNEHTSSQGLELMLEPILQGFDVGIISDAGCPGVADPGAALTKIAHEKNIIVKPLVGPSSILLSLMASGMNGQHFSFLGYLPAKTNERIKAIREIEIESAKKGVTQIFIEAPYRNDQLLADLLSCCHDHTRLCIAVDITLETEFIRTKKISEWRKKVPELHKRPAIFLLQKDF